MISIGDIINVKAVCEELNVPYIGALYAGFKDVVKFASSETELRDCPVILKYFGGDHKYVVIKAHYEPKAHVKHALSQSVCDDVIKVVRCKECMHYNGIDAYGWCRRVNYFTHDNDYCSNAEQI